MKDKMRVLLDECLPRRFAGELEGHDVKTVVEMGWSGKSNGELLDLASNEFDVFITLDQGLEYQQNLEGLQIAIILVHAKSSRLPDLVGLAPMVMEVLPRCKPGQLVVVKG